MLTPLSEHIELTSNLTLFVLNKGSKLLNYISFTRPSDFRKYKHDNFNWNLNLNIRENWPKLTLGYIIWRLPVKRV
jgi:hypothetical protein